MIDSILDGIRRDILDIWRLDTRIEIEQDVDREGRRERTVKKAGS